MNRKYKKRLGMGALLLPFAFIVVLFLMINCARIQPGMPPNIVLEPEQLDSNSLHHRKEVRVIATDYYQAGPVTKLVQGRNYRMAWAAPVEAEILWLDTVNGGLRVTEEGGGGQTHSLELIDSTGNIYTLRSVAKDPGPSVPDLMLRLKLEDIVYDAMSAGHPYGAIPAARLSDYAGVLHTKPRLVFVPKQPVLGEHNEDFGDVLYIFEYEAEDESGEWTGLEGVNGVIDSDDAAANILEDPFQKADQKALLRARLLDLLIGDWDRHAGQWGWARVERDSGIVYIPVATDRDNVFYKIGGILPWLISRPIFQFKYRPFKKKIHYMEGMLVNGEALSTFFLNKMNEEDYLEAAETIQQRLTDERIEAAIRAWPDTIYALDGEETISKLKYRRDDLQQYARQFYELMAKAPEIHGSILPDHFKLEAATDGSVTVSVEAPDTKGKKHLIYKRTFEPDVTREIRLFSWEGDDVFYLEGDGSPIAIKISGGDGTNEIRYMTTDQEVVSWNLKIREREDWKKMPKGVRIFETSFKPLMPE